MSKKNKSQPVVGLFEQALNKAVDSYTLAEHPELLEPLMKSLGLESYFNFFQEYGTRNSFDRRVYHGRTHSFQVALNCYEGGLYAHLSTSELKTILVAGLYHDANHTQGDNSDPVNISLALDRLKAAQLAAPDHQRLKQEEYLAACEAIKLTEYPYKVKETKSTLGRVLRDADMMGLYTNDVDLLLDMYLGLHAEINVTRTGIGWREDEMTMDEFRQKQKEFTSRQSWNTSWGKIKAFKRNWPEASRRLDHMLRLWQLQVSG